MAGVEEMVGEKNGHIGAISGSCKLLKESLSPKINNKLRKEGVAVIPIPESKVLKGKLALKACQQYAIPEFEENIVLLDTGHAKLMTPFFPLNALREIPGLENARYEDPYAGGIGNSIRYTAMAPRDDALKVLHGMFLGTIVLPGSLETKLTFLGKYGIEFGAYLEAISGSTWTIIWLVLTLFIVLFGKNSMEKREDFQLNYKSALLTSIYFSIGVMMLTRVSEFLYFNF